MEQEQTTNKQTPWVAGALIVAILVILVGAYAYIHTNTAPTSETNTAAQLPEPPHITPDNVVFPDGVSQSKRESINALIATLQEDPNKFNEWIQLGLELKAIDDYAQARDVWEYASAIRPKNSISFIDLGDLYAYYLHDNTLAEKNFLTAIKNDPTQTSYYFKTSDFYKNILKDDQKAVAIVKQGVTANPEDTDLQALLSSLKPQ
jgi:cytochrome c-type biogenesis protein CcmH/NrfG